MCLYLYNNIDIFLFRLFFFCIEFFYSFKEIRFFCEKFLFFLKEGVVLFEGVVDKVNIVLFYMNKGRLMRLYV